MKQFFLSLVALAGVTMAANAQTAINTLWETSGDPVMVSWGSADAKFSGSKAAEIAIGDEIVVYVTSADKSLDPYPQVSIKGANEAWKWFDICEGVLTGNLVFPATVVIPVNEAIYDGLQNAVNGAWISGCATTITKVEHWAYAEPKQTVDLSLDNLGSGWSSTYNAATRTITYESAWAGRGWWIGGDDYSEYESVTIEFANPLEAYAQIVIQYGDETETTEGVGETAESLTVMFDEEKRTNVRQIYLQSSIACDIQLKAAYLNKVPKTLLTVGETGYATYTNSKTMVVPAGVTLYTAVLNEGKTAVNIEEYTESKLLKLTPVIVKAEAGNYTFAASNVDPVVTVTNDLQGAYNEVAQEPGCTYYVLAKGTDGVGFYKLSAGQTIPAGKAYIQVAGEAPARISIGDDATSISVIEALETQGAIYNINGQEVKQTKSGLYIINGKKAIMK